MVGWGGAPHGCPWASTLLGAGCPRFPRFRGCPRFPRFCRSWPPSSTRWTRRRSTPAPGWFSPRITVRHAPDPRVEPDQRAAGARAGSLQGQGFLRRQDGGRRRLKVLVEDVLSTAWPSHAKPPAGCKVSLHSILVSQFIVKDDFVGSNGRWLLKECKDVLRRGFGEGAARGRLSPCKH